VGERLEVASMIGFLGFFVVIDIFLLAPNFGKYSSHLFLLPISLFWLALSFAWPEVKDAIQLSWWAMYILLILFLILLLTIFIIAFIKLRRNYVIHSYLMIYSVATLVFALVVWAPEEVFNYCIIPQTSQFQILHGVWQVMFSISVFLFYCFLRSISFARATDAILWCPAILLQPEVKKG